MAGIASDIVRPRKAETDEFLNNGWIVRIPKPNIWHNHRPRPPRGRSTTSSSGRPPSPVTLVLLVHGSTGPHGGGANVVGAAGPDEIRTTIVEAGQTVPQ